MIGLTVELCNVIEALVEPVEVGGIEWGTTPVAAQAVNSGVVPTVDAAVLVAVLSEFVHVILYRLASTHRVICTSGVGFSGVGIYPVDSWFLRIGPVGPCDFESPACVAIAAQCLVAQRHAVTDTAQTDLIYGLGHLGHLSTRLDENKTNKNHRYGDGDVTPSHDVYLTGKYKRKFGKKESKVENSITVRFS